ncbi:hypothetical protein FE257_010258 [Aspergillus nanangensis]|uniref:Zn(2)-C6 fungal-type domain-containing protein n=1 Tax=Aspergillus nanangensis TaxID=2582783 RepID=A0AAD4CKG4_ASPNN|nr:hypothetical protein FE257_010258 [Aspergillus nanangensis]
MGSIQGSKKAGRTSRRVKGCYECSQRRISCDRTQPQCEKCVQKGLQCSGLGVRYRFNNGVAARGKLAGKTVTGDTQDTATTTSSSSNISAILKSKLSQNPVLKAPSVGAQGRDQESQTGSNHTIDFISNHLDPLESWKRSLVNYWSDHIAPTMVAVDDEANGYRTMILPAVELEESLLCAISAASSYHLALRLSYPDKTKQYAQQMYTEVINGLVRKSQQIVASGTGQDPPILVVLTIIVMLVCAMITGSCDFPILFRMLSSLHAFSNSEASNWRENISFKGFLDSQVRKFELYAGPLIDESEGLKKVQGAMMSYEGLECLSRCVHLHPEYSISLQYNLSLIQQACEIYSLRVSNILDDETSMSLVASFKDTLSQYPSSGQGRNTIIWATFIAAAESSHPQHQAFFRNIFTEFYSMNGFGNILIALKMLEDIWNRDPEQKWTSILPTWGVFVM